VYDAPRPAPPVREVEPRTTPSAAGWLALAIWAGLAILAFLGATGVVAVFARMTDNLPPVTSFNQLSFQEQSVIYDRTGKVELARFGGEQRQVVEFQDIPPIVIDAQTAVEDKTFWDNAGFDPLAIISAGIDGLRGNSRGASTITQQLVRQRLLPEALVQDPTKTFERKIKEIIQSIRLTEAYPGTDGKKKIIAAYLNQNYYGDQAYGVKAAAKAYFGVDDLSKLTPAQAAILAGLVRSPSNDDLVKNANEECVNPSAADTEDTCASGKSQLVVPPDARIVDRRNMILDLLAAGRTPLSKTQYTPDQLEAAKRDPVVLAPQTTPPWIAPHFVWAVQQELADKICGADTPTCDELAAGGLTITTTLDANLQKIAEKWVQAAAIVPNSKSPATVAKSIGVPYEQWMKNLKGKDVHNGAMVAIDYQTGELVAYVGSANYYATKSSKQFQPKFDVVGSGFRQPGSAFKPFNYLTGIDDGMITAATLLMDTSTDFGGKYTPADADNLERGPVRVRNALQFSLNIPSVKTAIINTPDHVFARAKDFGMAFQTDTATAGASIALGVQEVRPVDLVTAYATLANGGKRIGHTTILSITDQQGHPKYTYQPPPGEQVAKPQSAFIVTDILAGNTNPRVNPFWGKFEITGPGKKHRPATLKTGTNNDAKDLNAYGFIAPPKDAERAAGQYALAVGAWAGNSDNTPVSTPSKPVFSIDVTTFMWQGFMQDATAKWAIDDFARPSGVDQAKIDPFTGLKPSSGGPSIDEWFIKGSEPKDAVPAGSCGEDVLKMNGIFEGKFSNWLSADADWIARAERGPGNGGGVNGSRTAYFYNGQFRPFGASWGAIVTGHGCAAPSPSVTCFPVPTADASGIVPSFEVPSADPSANIVFEPCATPSSAPSASASASIEPSASLEPSIEPTPTVVATPAPTPPPTAAPTPQPTKTPKPTPNPTPAPTATPAPSA
jgi:membrane peptidoglycan carboxypeptidase